MISRMKSRVFDQLTNEALFYTCLILLAMMKLWLVSGEEIVASSQGYDMAWHILSASRGVWFGSNYDQFSFIHLPVSPLWIATVHFTGIPLRIAVELLLLGSGFYSIYALRSANISRYICAACFVLIVFNPWTFKLFNLTLAEIPYTSLMLAVIAAAILVVVHLNDPSCFSHSLCLGLWSALLWNLRKENILIALLLVLLGMISVLVIRYQGKTRGESFRKLRVTFFVPITIVALVTVMIMTLNYWKWGLFSMTELSSNGYKAAYKALLRIKPVSPQRYVSITKNARRTAYEVSPSFRELRTSLENPLNGYSKETERVTGIRNEIAAGWFYWALRDAVATAGHLRSAREGEIFFQKIADEINGAIDEGRIEGRFTPFTFLDPDILSYLPNIPESFLKIWKLFISRREMPDVSNDASPDLAQVYDRVANRRAALVGQTILSIKGWVLLSTDAVVRVTLRDARGDILGETASMQPRGDVQSLFLQSGEHAVPLKTGFLLSIGKSHEELGGACYVFTTSSGKEITAPYSDIRLGEMYMAKGESIDRMLRCTIDSFTPMKHAFGLPAMAQKAVWKFHGCVVEWLTYLGAVAVISMALCRRAVRWNEPANVVMILLAVVVSSRVALFALLDASSWSGDQGRYLLPVMPLYSCFLVLLLNQAWQVGRQFFCQGRSSGYCGKEG